MCRHDLIIYTWLLLALGAADIASAAIINVPADQPTIQAAINAAVSGVDEVVVAPGTYNEVINFNGKAVNLQSSGGAAVTILRAIARKDFSHDSRLCREPPPPQNASIEVGKPTDTLRSGRYPILAIALSPSWMARA